VTFKCTSGELLIEKPACAQKNVLRNKVLIVDDSLIVREKLRELLEANGFEVVAEAETCEQALDAYKKHLPDMVTLDIVISGPKNGIDTLGLIKERDPFARIIMISALDQQKLIRESLQKGALDFVIKPFTEERVIATLKSVLQRGVVANL